MPSRDFHLSHAIMYSFDQHFLSTCCAPRTVLVVSDTSVNKRNTNSGLHGETTPAGKDRHNDKHNKGVHYIVCSCRKINTHGSCISTHLASKKLIASCSGLFFQGCLCSKQPWKLEIVSPLQQRETYFLSSLIKLVSLLEQGTSVLTVCYERFRSPEHKFLSCNMTHHVGRSHPVLFTSACGNQGSGNWCENDMR